MWSFHIYSGSGRTENAFETYKLFSAFDILSINVNRPSAMNSQTKDLGFVGIYIFSALRPSFLLL